MHFSLGLGLSPVCETGGWSTKSGQGRLNMIKTKKYIRDRTKNTFKNI